MNEVKIQALINALVNRPNLHNQKLVDLANEAQAFQLQPDWFWHALIRSFATWGGAMGYQNLVNNGGLDDLQYFRIKDLVENDNFTYSDIVAFLEQVFAEANIRYSSKKARYLAYNFYMFDNHQEVIDLSNELWELNNVEGFIERVMQFKGIGKKYARNIGMDLNHPAFINTIAIDSRIEKVLSALEYNGPKTYENKEAALLNIAEVAGLTGWQLDRLLFNFNFYYLNILNFN
ncbi:MAG: hypothetical protein ACK4K9_06255 [Bacteroidia bacterium]